MSKQTKKNTKPAAVIAPVADAATKRPNKTKTAKPAADAATTNGGAAVVADDATAKKPEPAAKLARAVDAFGSAVGSKAAAVNAALTKEPRSMKQIMEAAGQTTTFYNHLNRLVAAGQVVKTDDGYRLA